MMDSNPVVSLTPSAVREVQALLSLPDNQGKFMRYYVEKGGCSGMQYGMVFDEVRDGDFVSEQSGVKVLVDSVSVEYLRGMVVDFNDSMTGGGFKISNPNARQSCGCGKSFAA